MENRFVGVVEKLKKILLLPLKVKTQNEKKIIKLRKKTFSPFQVPEFEDEFLRWKKFDNILFHSLNTFRANIIDGARDRAEPLPSPLFKTI